jgi:hypothetical protein
MSEIFIPESLYQELILICAGALPHKAFGLVSGSDLYHPKGLHPCKTNLRNEPEWRPLFESFGDFYKDPDLGFVISHPEVKAVLESIDARQEAFIGVFHSHRFLRAEPTKLDLFLSSDSNLFSYIVSVVDPSNPDMGVFRFNGGNYERIMVHRY